MGQNVLGRIGIPVMRRLAHAARPLAHSQPFLPLGAGAGMTARAFLR